MKIIRTNITILDTTYRAYATPQNDILGLSGVTLFSESGEYLIGAAAYTALGDDRYEAVPNDPSLPITYFPAADGEDIIGLAHKIAGYYAAITLDTVQH